MTARKSYHKYILNIPPFGTANFFIIFLDMKVYLDEAGDLGWSFQLPYRNGGSSRYLTISYLIIPVNAVHLPERLVRDTYKKFNFKTTKEKKGKDLKPQQLEYVALETVKMLKNNPDFKIGAITVKKERVMPHIRLDANKLYNYMIGISVLDKIDKFPNVELVRDERTIKVASGNSCVDYLQIKLWFHRNSITILKDSPQCSHTNMNLIFVDWICSIVWSHYEDANSRYFQLIQPAISADKLYF